MLVVESLGRTEYHGDVQYHYSYRVIKDKVTFLDGCMKDIQSYGIEVERQDIVNGKLVRIERTVLSALALTDTRFMNYSKCCMITLYHQFI